MGKVIKKKIQGMNFWSKAGLVLLFTLATSMFMYQGWYKPLRAQAAVGVLGTGFPATPNMTATTGNLSGTYTVPAGTNRAVVICVQSYDSGGSAGITYSGTYGTNNVPMRSVGVESSNRRHSGILYLSESDIASATGNTVNITVTGTHTNAYAYIGTYSGVDNTTPTSPINSFIGSYNNNLSSAYISSGTATAGTGANVLAGGYGIYTWSITAGNTRTSDTESYIESADSATAGVTTGVATKLFASATTTDPLITWSTTTRASSSLVTLNPAPTSGNLTVGDNSVSNVNVPQASTGNAMDGFTMFLSAGSGSINTVTLTGSAQFTAANVTSVKVYRDNGTVGVLDGADVLVPTTYSHAGSNATITFTTPEPVSTTTGNYLVTVDVAAGATVTNTLSGRITAATGSIGTPSYNDASSATLTITAGAGLTVGDGTNHANQNAARTTLLNELDSFTMVTTTGTANVNTLTLTGSANFTTANIAGVKVYSDSGTLGTLDGTDAEIPTTYSQVGTVGTITFVSPESVSTTTQNYIVTVAITAGATLAQTFTGTITAGTGSGYVSSAFNDTASATLTITAAQTLTVGNGTNPANANIKTGGSTALDGFTLGLNTGTATVSSLTLTGSANFTTANIIDVGIYVDNGVVGTYEPGTDTPVAFTYSQVGTVGTITFSTPLAVTATPVSYLAVAQAKNLATVGNTFTGTITSATGSGIGTVTYSDTTSATLTIIAGPVVTITNCGGCHFYTGIVGKEPSDGTGRNVPAGKFQGNHATHAGNTATAGQYGFACTVCHKDNGLSPAGNIHQSGFINLSGSKLTGSAYSNGTYPGSATHKKAVSNSPTFYSCSNTYCHSNGTSVSTGTIPANTSPTWGAAAGSLNCGGCHGTLADNGRPNYVNKTPKANTHGDGAGYGVTHKTLACTRCHNSVTGTPGAYVTVASLHNNGTYDVGAANVGYTYAAGGGTCNATGTGCHGAGVVTWGGVLGCIDCHNAVQATSAATQLLDATVTSRPIMTAGFILAQSHTRSRASAAVTSQDCCVCHMEGDVSTGGKNPTYHGNGYVELRDPDLGTTIKAVTHSGTNAAEGSYTSTANDAKFVRFKRNLGIRLETETAVVYTGVTNFQVLGGIMVNHCLKCHDANGATSATAQITGGSPFKPFGATVAANGTNQGVLDVNSQFASTNRSQHPVLIKNNNGYTNTSGTRLLAPWNGSATKTGTTTVYGALISCWDCHAPNGSTTATTVTNTNAALITDTHGRAKTVAADAVELRGSVYLSSTTTAGNLCLNCHVVSGGTTLHGAGSAMQTSGSNGSMTYFQNRCYFCHSGVETNAHAARPIGAGDVHGYGNLNSAGGALAAGRGYAFIRRTGLGQLPALVGATAYTATCGSGTGICNQGMGTYSPGGKF